jgi:hypothetical protein
MFENVGEPYTQALAPYYFARVATSEAQAVKDTCC